MNKKSKTNKSLQDKPDNKTDIKYLKIPNICFSLTSKDDEREIEFSKQRKKRGFDDSETWSLTDTICKFILPRLKRFKNLHNYRISSIGTVEWNNILDKMILSFSLIERDNGLRNYNDEELKQIDEGLNLFREWFMELYW
jgi:hypothetical protein